VEFDNYYGSRERDDTPSPVHVRVQAKCHIRSQGSLLILLGLCPHLGSFERVGGGLVSQKDEYQSAILTDDRS
jgi:hypothetical protein